MVPVCDLYFFCVICVFISFVLNCAFVHLVMCSILYSGFFSVELQPQ